MVNCTKEISKEVYDKAMENNGHIPGNMEMEVFGPAICCGYGLYGTRVREEDGKYYVDYKRGSSCD